MFEKRHNWSVSIRFNSQLIVWVIGSVAMRGGPTCALFRGPTATEGPETEEQACNQLQTPRGEEFSERGTISLNFVQHIFPGEHNFF